MASIDKIYAKYEQYLEFKTWCREHYPKALKYIYPWYDEWNDDIEHPIANFPEKIDKYLLKNCPIKWVTDRIKEQYGLDK